MTDDADQARHAWVNDVFGVDPNDHATPQDNGGTQSIAPVDAGNTQTANVDANTPQSIASADAGGTQTAAADTGTAQTVTPADAGGAQMAAADAGTTQAAPPADTGSTQTAAADAGTAQTALPADAGGAQSAAADGGTTQAATPADAGSTQTAAADAGATQTAPPADAGSTQSAAADAGTSQATAAADAGGAQAALTDTQAPTLPPAQAAPPAGETPEGQQTATADQTNATPSGADPAGADPGGAGPAGADPAGPAATTQTTSASVPVPAAGAPDPGDLEHQCNAFLDAKHFHAELAEVVPGDRQCLFYLADHLVKQEDVAAALSAGVPGAGNDTAALWQIVRARWDLELTQGIAFSTDPMPPQASLVRPMPDNLLARKLDGQTFWQPAPVQTWGVETPKPAPAGWLKDFFDFYEIAAPDDPNASAGTCVFNGTPGTLDDAVSAAAEQAGLAGYAPNPSQAQSLAKAMLDARVAASQQGRDVAKRAEAPPDAPGPAPNQGVQINPSVALQTSHHWDLTKWKGNLPAPGDPAQDTVVQFQFAVTDAIHPDGKTGPEFQGQLVIAYNVVTQEMQVVAGAQFTEVLAVWGAVQAQYFINPQAGIAKSLSTGAAAHGVFTWQTGGQVAVTVGPVQFALQAGAGTTITNGAPTGDVSGQFSITGTFGAGATPKADAGPPPLDIHELEAMNMAQLLDALDAVAKAGELSKIPANSMRIAVAVRTVGGDYEDDAKQQDFYEAVGKLDAQDQPAVKQYIFRHIGK